MKVNKYNVVSIFTDYVCNKYNHYIIKILYKLNISESILVKQMKIRLKIQR